MSPWRTLCPVCKKRRVVRKGVIQSHPNISNSGACAGGKSKEKK